MSPGFALLLLVFPVLLAAADDIRVTRVFGPETPPCKYKHPASITELQNGDLYLAFYGGSGEYDLDTADWGARLKKGESRWSTPQIIADTPFLSDGNPVVWQAPNGWARPGRTRGSRPRFPRMVRRPGRTPSR